MTTANTLWDEVRRRVEGLDGAERHIERLRKRAPRPEAAPEIAAHLLPDGEAQQAAADMLVAHIELLVLTERHRRAERRLQLRAEDFWLAVYEETGLTPDDPLTFSSGDGTVHRRLSERVSPQGSYEATLEAYRAHIRDVLHDKDKAAHTVLTPAYPEWLRETARAVTGGDLRPRLRAALEEALEDPETARRYADMAPGASLPAWFAQVMAVLGTQIDSEPARTE